MARTGSDPTAFKPAFMSGKGKSFFLHDLLKKVIFEERDWVSHDAHAVRRSLIWRSLGISTVTVLTLGAMAAFGWSFWQNATLVREADQQAAAYYAEAQPELNRELITDDSVRSILVPLEQLRLLRAGYVDSERPPFLYRLGLSQHRRINVSARNAYWLGLERLLRPRMIAHMETELRRAIIADDPKAIYEALEVYMVLSGENTDPANDDAVKGYFARVWASVFPGQGQKDEWDDINAHLAAMLEMDGGLSNDDRVLIQRDLIAEAQATIADLDLAELAYADILAEANALGLPEFQLTDAVGGRVEEALSTNDGSPLSDLQVPGLYTFEGYWAFFSDQMSQTEERLEAKRWVLGDEAERVDYDDQLGSLQRDVHNLYKADFVASWNAMLARIAIGDLARDPPIFDGLDALQSTNGSPLLGLIEAVEYETRLSRLYDALDEISAEDIAGGGLGDALGDAALRRLYNQSGTFSRVILEQVGDGRAQNQLDGPSEDSQRRQVELISNEFRDWHALLRGTENGRPIDGILQNISAVYVDRRTAANGGVNNEAISQELLTQLTNANSAFPEAVRNILNGVEEQFRSASQNSTLEELNRMLRDEVTSICQAQIENFYPFGSGGHIPTADFGEFFGHGGVMDRFYTERLSDYVRPGANGLEPRAESAVGQRINPAALRGFDQAQAIRSAFFAPNSRIPEVKMYVAFDSSSPAGVVPFLNIHGTILTLRFDGNAAEVAWPGNGTGVTLQLTPALSGRTNELSFRGGRWAIVEFMQRATTSIDGNVARVTHDIGGRTVTFTFEFDRSSVPFLMSELQNFSCPTSLD